MPTASTSGSHNASRRNWRAGDRARSRPGTRPPSRSNPFAQLSIALRALIRCHQPHPDWVPPVPGGPGGPSLAALDPEWEAAIVKAYRLPPPADSTAKT